MEMFESIKINPEIQECKGLVFRGFHSVFYDSLTMRIERREGIRLLKKRSCPGCKQCGFLLDAMDDMISTNTLLFPEEGIEHGKLYTIIVVNESRDWESGQIDEWDFEIIKVKREGKR